MSIIINAGRYEGVLNTDLHSHYCCEMFYLKKGEITLSVGEKSYRIKENSVYILSPFERHSVVCHSKEYERYIIFLSLPDFEIASSIPSLSIILKNRPPQYNHLFKDVPTAIGDIFRQSVLEFETNKTCPYTNHRITNLISDLLILLYRHSPDHFLSFQRNDRLNERLIEIQRYIEDNFDKRLKISDIAHTFNMNPYYFSHSFKAFSGYSPKQYLTKVQFTHVRQMLISSDLTITEIAEQTGFETTNDLSRKFKQEFSMSPSDFRKGNISRFANPH